MSWEDVKITSKSVNEFLNKIDMNAVTKNAELFFKEIDNQHNKENNNKAHQFQSVLNDLISSTNTYIYNTSKLNNYIEDLILKNINIQNKTKEVKIKPIEKNDTKSVLNKLNTKINTDITKNAIDNYYYSDYHMKKANMNRVNKDLQNKKAA